jgi:DNA repair protein RecN (Recombination protein N)
VLRSLHIENYVLIDSLDISLPEGLGIITGQTGAGKSILLGALSLLMGAKGDATQISAGAQNCIVEGEFSAPDSIRSILEDAEVEWDGGNLLIRRVLNASGRSRSFINDSPVNVQLLQEIASSLVDIHSQHQSLQLSDRRFQMDVLDHFAGCAADVEECKRLWNVILCKTKELEEVRGRLSRLQADKEYNSARFKQLDDAHLRDGELEELDAEQKQLANAESIKETFAAASALLEPEEGMSVEVALKEAERLLGKLSQLVPDASSLAERLHSSRIEISDIAESIVDLDSRISLSQERLEQVEDRMSLLYGLMQKHGCANVAELLAARERYAEALFDSTALEEKAAALEKEVGDARKEHLSVCTKIHAARAKAAPGLAAGIQESLRFLELDRAVFAVELADAAPSATGSDAVTFKFSSTGSNPVDVSRCASGGEISRIMLSLKALMAQYTGMPTMIFDEIDTGVSGSAADKMGQMICRMGKDMQVLSITHLPQVAAKGRAHFVVEKSISGDGSVSSMRRLSDEERVQEIARLLSGERITPEAIANARTLLA